eukprot:evm.model.scf_2415.2 EVM.evm.TU.scf_2415.2   scf_2415:11208-16306(+)
MVKSGAADSNIFNFPEYDGQTEFFPDGEAALSQGVGYAVVLGFGGFFSLFTTAIVLVDYYFGGTRFTSEQFNCAGRSIKTGLTASVIVSQWTWAATLLQSSNVAYKFGVSGPFWYASGATIQVLLFGILAIEVKRKAPTCHTILEIIEARWGQVAHIVFLFFCLLTNIIVTAMLLLGGAAVVNALTGVDLNAAAFLIPIGVILYTAAGGLKATFLASYIHTTVIFIALCIFMFQIYATHEDLGSPAEVYKKLRRVEEEHPVEDNLDGSYLTMLSRGGFIFGIINVVGNFGTVFVDQSYWQSAIAAKPSCTYKGYLLGGLCWFAIPFTLATALGLGAVALDLPLTSDEAGDGLVPPATAVHLMGKGGAVLILIMLFMAVTSTGSAELIAVSSLLSYDVYRTYFNPKATGADIIRVSRYICVVWGCAMGALAIGLQELGLNLGWVYLAMGVLIGSAVIPIAFCLTWSKCSRWGAIIGALVGQWAGIITWLVWAKVGYEEITVDTTGKDFPMLAGNLMSILSSGFICVVISLIYPEETNWDETRRIPMLEHDPNAALAKSGEDSYEGMTAAFAWTVKYGAGGTAVLVIAWPVLALPAKVFTESYFTFWVIIAMIWGLAATVVIIVLPIWESKDQISTVMSNLLSGQTVVVKDDMQRLGSAVDDSAHNPAGILKEGQKEAAEVTTEEV